jgi:hypothetical protein
MRLKAAAHRTTLSGKALTEVRCSVFECILLTKILVVDDIMYGVAKASSKRDANEGAAKKTIEMLEREGQIVA